MMTMALTHLGLLKFVAYLFVCLLQVATEGIAAAASDDNCGTIVETTSDPNADPEATDNIDGATGLDCGYPDSGTWVDSCFVVDPDNIVDVLRARCDQRLTKAYVT
jgi:hypothetical protein